MTRRIPFCLVAIGALAAGCATKPASTEAAPGLAPVETAAATPAAAATTAELPRTQDTAVAAFHREFPSATFDEAVRPKGFANGDGIEPPLWYVIRSHEGDTKRETQISPDGLLMRRDAKLSADQVPSAVAGAIAKAGGAAGATVMRMETLTRIGYVEAAKPSLAWLVTVEKNGKAAPLLVKADGSVARGGGEADEGDEADEKDEKDETKPGGKAAPKEVEAPAEAVRAVAAVKAAYPGAILTGVETVPIDDGTGHFDVLQYEVEIFVHGAGKDVLATPDGIVLQIDRPTDVASVPAAVAAAIAKESAGGKVKSVVAIEGHGDLRLLPLAEPRVVFETVLERAGKKAAFRVNADGREVRPLGAGSAAAATGEESEKSEASEKNEKGEKGEEADEVDVRDVAAALKISLSDAIAAAIAAHAGDVVEAGIEGEGKGETRSVFVEVMVLDAAGKAIEVKVDPATGKVLSSGPSDEEDESAELGAVLEALPAGHLSLAELTRRAAAGAEGAIVTGAFVLAKDHHTVGAFRFVVGKALWQVTLDPVSGAVLTKGAAPDEEEDEADEDDESMEKK